MKWVYLVITVLIVALILWRVIRSIFSGKSGSKGPCKGCIPEQGFQHMGVIWEVKDK